MMVSFIVQRVRGPWAVAAIAASIGYGWLIIVALPYWRRLEAAQGGDEIQTRFGYGAAEAGVALSAIDAHARADAFAFYALDVGNAFLYALGIAAMIAFGLRQLRWDATWARWLIAAPLIAGGADLAENGCLAAALASNPGAPGWLGDAAGVFTSIKFAAGFPAQILGLVLLVAGLAAWAWRALRHPKN